MTEEMKNREATRFLIIEIGDGDMSALKIVDEAGTLDAAKTVAEGWAIDAEGITFGVFQKVGGMKASVKANWKGVEG